ncbi:thioredoxin [Candidatus Microgenomates bacterium]|nr:MAG: thioredoxin [Candidatus Microgenomates bacterium]
MVVTDQNFDQEVLQSKIPVLVDFWAQWCMPCKMISPIIDEIAKDYEGKIKVAKLDVDENPASAGKFGIMSIPSIYIFKDGKPVKTLVGVQSKESLEKEIDGILG